MKTDVITHSNEFARLAPEWNDLLRASAADCPFLTPEWLHAWWTHLGESRRLHLVTVRDDGGQLIAVAPLHVARSPLGLFSHLEFLGTGYAGSDYLDLIVRRGYEPAAVEALGGLFQAQKLMLHLTHVASSSVAGRLAESLGHDGWTLRTTQAGVCPIVTLAGHTWESYLASLGASHRANFRRRLRTLERQFDVRFERVESDAVRQDVLAALVRFHEERFARGSTAFLTPALRAFHDDATRRALAAGWLRQYVLRLDGAPAAAMYGFARGDRFYFYQHGFDARYEPFSVGLVLMGLTIQAALAEGAAEFDMLFGTETYKALWARDTRPLIQYQLFPPHIGGRVHQRATEAERTMRTVARRLLTIGAARA